MEKKKRKATKGQRERIEGMLKSGLIDRAEAQRIIDAYHLPTPKRGEDLILSRRSSWEKRFPGKGAAIMELLAPFYVWSPELRQAVHDLEERTKQAIFWGDIRGVKAIGIAEANQLRARLPESAKYMFEWKGEGDLIRESLDPDYRMMIYNFMNGSLNNTFWHAVSYSSLFSRLGPFPRDCMKHWFGIMCYAVDCIIIGRPELAQKFKPLLDLWLAGNFPLVNDEGHILVLVAD